MVKSSAEGLAKPVTANAVGKGVVGEMLIKSLQCRSCFGHCHALDVFSLAVHVQQQWHSEPQRCLLLSDPVQLDAMYRSCRKATSCKGMDVEDVRMPLQPFCCVIVGQILPCMLLLSSLLLLNTWLLLRLLLKTVSLMVRTPSRGLLTPAQLYINHTAAQT